MNILPSPGIYFLRASLGFLVCDMAMYVIYYQYKKRRRTKKLNELYDCVIFHCGVYSCGPYCTAELELTKTKYSLDCVDISLRKIVQLIEKCENSVDIALYIFVCPQIIDTLIKIVMKKKSVRVITDGNEETNCDEEKFQDLEKKGIQVKKKKSTGIFHHKFIIIDKNLLFQGSCNYTNTAICGNCDNVLITSRNQIVQNYVKFFENLWENSP